MLTNTRLSLYIAFIVALAVWTGGGVFETISSHPAWYADPVAYTRTHAAPEGTVNPWPSTTAFLALSTLAALGAFVRYREAGRREVLLVLGATFLILVVTALYFVPTLFKLADHKALTDAQITSMSLLWMRLNMVRIVVLLALLTCSLVGLIRLVRPRAAGTAG
jgi:Domain of unknown function (DUF1772)